jgi:hypothetical protein
LKDSHVGVLAFGSWQELLLSSEVEHELRSEAMIIELESSSSTSNRASYFTDSHSNSDKEALAPGLGSLVEVTLARCGKGEAG